MAKARVHVVCPDTPTPSGGMLHLYRMVDLLNEAGYDAQVLHQQPGFRLTWYENRTRVACASQVNVLPSDYLVIPECLLLQVGRQVPGVRKVIYNQSAYLTFVGWGFEMGAESHPYNNKDIRATLVISEDSRKYLEHALPGHPVLRHWYTYDTLNLFGFRESHTKQRRAAFMPRKNGGDAEQVINILRQRGVLGSGPNAWSPVMIHNLPLAQSAAIIRESHVFLSFGHPEGCPLPPAEAMLAGTLVVGYHGNGGREYFTSETGFPIDVGDVIGFAKTAEQAIRSLEADAGAFDAIRTRARDLIKATYNLEAEKASLLKAWDEILALG